MKTIFRTILVSLLCLSAFGQQVPRYTSFYIDPKLVNPAYAGYKGENRIQALYRQQMLSMPSSPVSYMATYEGPFVQKNAGFSASLYNDEVNILGYMGAKGTYAYTVDMPKESKLALGLSLGITRNRILYNNIVAETPSELLQFYDMKPFTSYVSDFGAIYEMYDFEAGVSLTNISLNGNRDYFNEIPYKYKPQFNLSFRYDYDLDMDWAVRTGLVVRSPQGMAPTYDMSVVAYWHENTWGALFYNPSNSIGLGYGLNFHKYTTALSWEYPLSSLNKITYGALEMTIFYAFNREEKK